MDDQRSEPTGPFLKVREVAEMFGVTTATVRVWLNEGEIRGIKIGKGHYWRIPQSEATRLATERHGDMT